MTAIISSSSGPDDALAAASPAAYPASYPPGAAVSAALILDVSADPDTVPVFTVVVDDDVEAGCAEYLAALILFSISDLITKMHPARHKMIRDKATIIIVVN